MSEDATDYPPTAHTESQPRTSYEVKLRREHAMIHSSGGYCAVCFLLAELDLERASDSAGTDWEKRLPDDLDAMLAEISHALSEACTQTKNQNVIAAHNWVGRIREARSLPSNSTAHGESS